MAHTEYHKQDETYRVVIRGNLFFAQHHDGSLGDKKHDPWNDIGRPKPSKAEALAVMYGIKPEVRT